MPPCHQQRDPPSPQSANAPSTRLPRPMGMCPPPASSNAASTQTINIAMAACAASMKSPHGEIWTTQANARSGAKPLCAPQQPSDLPLQKKHTRCNARPAGACGQRLRFEKPRNHTARPCGLSGPVHALFKECFAVPKSIRQGTSRSQGAIPKGNRFWHAAHLRKFLRTSLLHSCHNADSAV